MAQHKTPCSFHILKCRRHFRRTSSPVRALVVVPFRPIDRPIYQFSYSFENVGFSVMRWVLNSLACIGVLVLGIVFGWAIGGVLIALVLS